MEAVIRLKRCCDEREDEIHARAQLTPAEYVCLKEVPADEPMGAGALSRRMGLSPSRGSRVIERLVRRGLLERRTLARDRRVTLLSLSTAGKRIKREIEACLAACDDRLRSRLSAREIRRADQGLTILLRAMGAS